MQLFWLLKYFAGPISGITTTAGYPISAGRTTWSTFQSEISTSYVSAFVFVFAFIFVFVSVILYLYLGGWDYMRYIPKWDIVIFRCMFYIIIIIFYVNICCIYWFVYNSYIETILTSYDYDVQAPWLPERDSESEIQVRERLQDLKMTKNKNPIPKAGNTKKLQKSWLSGFWNFSGSFS